MTARSLVSAESSCIPANSLNVLRLFSDGGMGEPAASRTRTGSVMSDTLQGTGVCVSVRLCVLGVCLCVCVRKTARVCMRACMHAFVHACVCLHECVPWVHICIA